jgi:transcriptional regulator with PAS, ATPase and Fis domain
MRRQRLNANTSDYNSYNNNPNIKELIYKPLDEIIDFVNKNTFECFCVISNKGNIMHVNESWQNMWKYKYKEIYNKNCKFLQGEKTEKEIIKNFENYLANEDYAEMKIINYTKDNQEICCLVKSYLIKSINYKIIYPTKYYLCEIKKIENK